MRTCAARGLMPKAESRISCDDGSPRSRAWLRAIGKSARQANAPWREQKGEKDDCCNCHPSQRDRAVSFENDDEAYAALARLKQLDADGRRVGKDAYLAHEDPVASNKLAYVHPDRALGDLASAELAAGRSGGTHTMLSLNRSARPRTRR